VTAGLVARRRSHRPAIFPFDESIGELEIGGVGLRAALAAAAAENGLVTVDVDHDDVLPDGCVVVVDDDVYVDGAALARIVAASKDAKGDVARVAVAADTALWTCSARLMHQVGPLPLPLWCGALGGRKAKDLDDADDVGVVFDDAGATAFDTRPYGRAPHQLHIADVPAVVGWPRHWLHVLDLSLAARQQRLRRAPARTRSHRGRRQRIHPTATVTGSILGDDVVVEAHAVVIDSIVGDGVLVGDHTVIHTAVIGDRCRTLVDTHLRRVVAMPGSTLSNLDMQDAVFGREVFLTTGVAFFHDGPGQNVVVDGEDSGRAVLAGAIGRRAVMGSRALFRCGLALPAGTLIVARPAEALGRVDARSLEKAHMRIGDPRLDF